MSEMQESTSDSNRAESQEDYPVKYFPPHVILAAQGNEISLAEMVGLLGRKRNLILGVVGISMLLSIALAFLIPPVYQATIHFLPPLKKDVDVLNIDAVEVKYTQLDIYKEFQLNFVARNNLWEFFREKKLYEAYVGNDEPGEEVITRIFEKKFLKALKLNKPKGRQDDMVFINATLRWSSSSEGAALLNGYTQTVMDRVRLQLVDELQATIQLGIHELDKKIDSLRMSSDSQKKTQIAVLEENIAIARSLGLKRADAFDSEKASPGVVIDTSSEEALYRRGYEVLEAERAAMLARKDNDPFIPGLPKLLEQRDYLSGIVIDDVGVGVARIAQPASASSIPVEPRKSLIIIFGFMVGLVAGVMLAFLTHVISEPREAR